MFGAPSPLLVVVDEFIRELDEIESIFARCKGDRTVVAFTTYTPTEEGCLFALWDAWTRFLRALVMECSAGATVGLAGGVYVPPIVRQEQAVLAHLTANKKGNQFGFVNGEPKWNSEVSLSDIVTALSLPNAATIIGSVTASHVVLGPITVGSPLEEIRIARNFAAHKNWKTLSDIGAYSAPGFTTLSDHLRRPRSGVPAFSEWKESLESLAAAAAQ